MPRALVLAHLFPDLSPECLVLESQDVEVVDGTPLDAKRRLDLAIEADALLVQYSTLDADVIDRLRRCRVIGSYGVGYDQIDVGAATARGITVVNVPDYATEEVSDHTLCLLLGVARGLSSLPAAVRRQLLGDELDRQIGLDDSSQPRYRQTHQRGLQCGGSDVGASSLMSTSEALLIHAHRTFTPWLFSDWGCAPSRAFLLRVKVPPHPRRGDA